MAFCEMCGANIPDGQTKCANCAAKASAPASAMDNMGAALSNQLGALKTTDINWIGLIAQIFNILMLCLPVLRKTHIWEIADSIWTYYFVAFGVIAVIGASVGGYLLKQEKVAKLAGIVNLVALLLVWFPFGSFSIGFYLWLIGVAIQLAAPILMKLFKENVR